jgi:hypothetical protein
MESLQNGKSMKRPDTVQSTSVYDWMTLVECSETEPVKNTGEKCDET